VTKIDWNSIGAYPGTVEKYLIREGLISEDEGIINIDKLLQFGIFSLLLWFLPYKKEYYSDPKNKLSGSYFNFYITGLDNRKKVIFLLCTETDQFIYPHRNIVISDPLNFLSNGDREHKKCSISHLISYNASYLKRIGLSIDLPDYPEAEEGCHSHKESIRNQAFDDNLFPAVFGGWPIPLEVDPEIMMGLEVQEKSNRDSLFNEFLSIYFKYKINATASYSNIELISPFNSHEIDVCILLRKKETLEYPDERDDIIMIETSAEFNIKDVNIKKKIYNLWSIEKIFNKGACFYLTFGELNNNTHLSSFMNSVGSDGKSPHFEIMNLPEFFKDIENSIKKIESAEELEKFHETMIIEFSSFLDDVEGNILAFL